MNIYFSCSLTGGRDDEAIYRAIVEHLHALGHEVPTAHLAHPEVMELEKVVDPAEVYQRDITWIQACDVVIAEVSTPSHGVGYEIAYALSLDKPVMCCYRRGMPVSKMLTGNDMPRIVVRSYENEADALAIVDVFLAGLRAG
jgi:nucleoside 2-deoxyribosyltransferase